MTTLIPPVTVDVFGYVYDGNSDPVENATITFQSSNNFFRDGNNYNIDEVVYTDRKGLFQIPLYVTKEGDRALATVQVVIEYTNTQGDDVVDKFDILVANPNDNPNDRSVNIERLIVDRGDVVIFSGPRGPKGDPGGAVGKERFFLARRDGLNPISLSASWQMIVDVNNLPEGVTLVQEEFDGKMIPAFTGPDSGDPIDDIELVVRVGNETFDTRTLWGFVPWDGDIVAGRAIANDSRLSIEVNNSNEVSLGIDLQGNIFIGSRNSIANAEVLLQGLVYGAGLRGLQGIEGPPGARGKDGGPFFIEGAAEITTAEFSNTGRFGYSTVYGESTKPLPGVSQIVLADGGSFRSLVVGLLANVNVKYVYIDGFQYSLNDGGVVIKDGQGVRFSFPNEAGVMFRFAMQLEDGTFVPDGAKFSPFAERVAEVSQGVEENRKKNLEQDAEIEALQGTTRGVVTTANVDALFSPDVAPLGKPEASDLVLLDHEVKQRIVLDTHKLIDNEGDMLGALAKDNIHIGADDAEEVYYAVTDKVISFHLGDNPAGETFSIPDPRPSRILLAHALFGGDILAVLVVRLRTLTDDGAVYLLTERDVRTLILRVDVPPGPNQGILNSTATYNSNLGQINGDTFGGYSFSFPDNANASLIESWQSTLFGNSVDGFKTIDQVILHFLPQYAVQGGEERPHIDLSLATETRESHSAKTSTVGQIISLAQDAINERIENLERDVHPVAFRTLGGSPLVTHSIYEIMPTEANSDAKLFPPSSTLNSRDTLQFPLIVDIPTGRETEINAIPGDFQLIINGQSATFEYEVNRAGTHTLNFDLQVSIVRAIVQGAIDTAGNGSIDVVLRKGSERLFRNTMLFSSSFGGGGGGIPEWDPGETYPLGFIVSRKGIAYVSKSLAGNRNKDPDLEDGDNFWKTLAITVAGTGSHPSGTIVMSGNNLFIALQRTGGQQPGDTAYWKQLTFTPFTPQFKSTSTTLGSAKMKTAELHTAFDRIGFTGLTNGEWYRVTYQIDFYDFSSEKANVILQIRAGARDTGPSVGYDNLVINRETGRGTVRFYISLPFRATSEGILTLGARMNRPHTVGRLFANAWLEKI